MITNIEASKIDIIPVNNNLLKNIIKITIRKITASIPPTKPVAYLSVFVRRGLDYKRKSNLNLTLKKWFFQVAIGGAVVT